MSTVTGGARWSAVGGFACLERLELALTELIAAAIGLHRMVVFCASRKLDEIARSSAPGELRHVRELIQDPSRVGGLDKVLSLPPDSPLVADLDLQAETSASGLFHGLGEIDEATPTLLLVSGRDPEELRLATRVLLAHSSLSVRTREHVALPSRSSELNGADESAMPGDAAGSRSSGREPHADRSKA